MQTRSTVALLTLILMVGLIYFGEFLPNGRAGKLAGHPHDEISCQSCHEINVAKAESQVKTVLSQNCVGCHANQTTATSLFHSGYGSKDCARCHSFHEPEFVNAAGDTMSLVFAKRAGAVCADCHKEGGVMPEVSAGHREAAALIHSQRTNDLVEAPSKFCLTCHDASRRNNIEAKSSWDVPRFHVSASHVYGETVVAGWSNPGSTLQIQDKLPSNLILINDKMECQTCHSMISKHEYLLSQKIADGLCTGCHDMQRESSPSPVFTVKS